MNTTGSRNCFHLDPFNTQLDPCPVECWNIHCWKFQCLFWAAPSLGKKYTYLHAIRFPHDTIAYSWLFSLCCVVWDPFTLGYPGSVFLYNSPLGKAEKVGANPILGSLVTGQQSSVYSLKPQQTPRCFRLSIPWSNAEIFQESFLFHQKFYIQH